TVMLKQTFVRFPSELRPARRLRELAFSQSCNDVFDNSEHGSMGGTAVAHCGHYNPRGLMEIRFISTLTADDEGQMAPALMHAVTALLDALPIAYTLRIETLGAQVFQHTHPSAAGDVVADGVGARRAHGAGASPFADMMR
ncbi:MAG TPA: hypothetical protein VFJ02_03635, partial [Vicinamibacterales bacterium]|nr:hypothetical protein [Vicinamibacterales bacterium]